MSYRAGQHQQHFRAEPPRQVQHPRNAPAPAARRQKQADYTFAHAGRQVRIGPVAFWIVVGSLVIMAGWSVATGTYFAFHDDVLKRLIARQVEMQYAYEDRIAELRAQVDRIASRQLLDQEQFEKKLDQVLSRQTVLEQRAATLSGLPDVAVTGSIKTQPARGAAGPMKPSPISDTVIFSVPPDREARLESRVPSVSERAASKQLKGGVDGTLSRLSQGLDKIEANQIAALGAIEESYDAKARRMRGVLADLGLNPGKPVLAGSVTTASAAGGPFIPLRNDPNSFERQLHRISVVRTHVERLTHTLNAVPVRKPVFGEIDMSSPFGMRMDPFVKGPAIHSGVDMRGDTGDPVRATATGTVTTAGWNGGYGKMVEIDHGNGFTTRYGHLSDIDVKVGQNVRIGQIIGNIGSTGRSTGPHLHYETRIDGDAVDPQKFLRAGLRLGAT